MIDRRLLLDDPAQIESMCRARGTSIDLAALQGLERERKRLQSAFDALRHEQKTASQAIGKAKQTGEDASPLLQKMSGVADELKGLHADMQRVEGDLRAGLLLVPNFLDATTPAGTTATDNPTIRTWGTPPTISGTIEDHVAIGERLGLFDFDRAAKLAGARFVVSRGMGARLERALMNFMLDMQISEHGYTEIQPPLLVNAEAMTGTGQLPKFADDLFQTTDGRYLIPTAEVPLTNLYAGETVSLACLPMRFVAATPCFRSEAGSYGKDTRGLIRQHQFNKVELVSFVPPERSAEELERMTNCAESILQRLALPYRVVALCGGDIGFAAAKTYDLEVWLPAQNAYREISSCSNCTDFQARRASIRFHDTHKKTQFLHTLNGSGLAVGRTLIALLENFQQPDGTVTIPDALRPYLDGIGSIS